MQDTGPANEELRTAMSDREMEKLCGFGPAPLMVMTPCSVHSFAIKNSGMVRKMYGMDKADNWSITLSHSATKNHCKKLEPKESVYH